MNKLRTLEKIEEQLRTVEQGGSDQPPWFLFGISGALVGLTGSAYFAIKFPWMAISVCFILGWLICYLSTRNRKPLEAQIYDALARYEPLDNEGYQRLQQLAADDSLTRTNIREWICAEKEALNGKHRTIAVVVEESRLSFSRKQ